MSDDSNDDIPGRITAIWASLENGKVAAALRDLRWVAEKAPIMEVAKIVERASVMMQFDELTRTTTRVVATPKDPQALFDFGYGCIEHGIAFAAIPALRIALHEAPGQNAIITELVSALEEESRYSEAVQLLQENQAALSEWLNRYLLVFNSIMAGNIDQAKGAFRHLGQPEDKQFDYAAARLGGMLERIDLVSGLSPLDKQDVRGWHFALNAGIVGILSPFGFSEGMNGRFAYLQDNFGLCLRGLRRLQLVLNSANRAVRRVGLLPDRSSDILGRAAAEVLGVPAQPWNPDEPDAVVIAYNLRNVEDSVIDQLRYEASRQILFEHATCWTEPPMVTPDISTVFHQVIVAPWEQHATYSPEGSATQVPADERPADLVSSDIVNADPTPPEGDPDAPSDADEDLADFVSRIREVWADWPDFRDRMWSPGPVRSNRFL